jgi:hypothetical protein
MNKLEGASMVALFGDLLCDSQKDKNNWKKRMLNTVEGIEFPDDWDELPEDEKQERLDKAINEGAKNA